MSKYVFNSNFKAIFKGPFASASTESGEFEIDFDVKPFPLKVIQMKEIAAENKLDVVFGKNMDVNVKQLFDALETLKISEVNKMTESNVVKEIVKEGIELDKSDDEMLVAIVNAGVSFRKAVNLFNAAMQELGMRISAKERAEKVADLLGRFKIPEPLTWSFLAESSAKIAREIPGTEDKQVIAIVKRLLKAEGLEIPAKPKAEKGGSANSFRAKLAQWLYSTENLDEENYMNFMIGELGKKKEIAEAFRPFYLLAVELRK